MRPRRGRVIFSINKLAQWLGLLCARFAQVDVDVRVTSAVPPLHTPNSRSILPAVALLLFTYFFQNNALRFLRQQLLFDLNQHHQFPVAKFTYNWKFSIITFQLTEGYQANLITQDRKQKTNIVVFWWAKLVTTTKISYCKVDCMECSLPKGSIKIPLYVSCVSGEFYCGVNVPGPDSHMPS